MTKLYLIVSVICENSIDTLRSYSAKKTQILHLILSIFIKNKIILNYFIVYMSLYYSTASIFVSFTEILLPHVFHHVSWS